MAELSGKALDFLQHVTSRIEAKRAAKHTPHPSPAENAQMDQVFRQAAVQHVFAFGELIPEDSGIPETVRRALEAQSYVAPGQRAAELRSLRRSVRLEYLTQIATADAALALLANADKRTMTPTQAISNSSLPATSRRSTRSPSRNSSCSRRYNAGPWRSACPP